uniref:Xylulose kinase-1 n=1 Tax=Tanacetum cinerariifolium TaxID=118510 RepID=A0A6L2NG06_TANCI|nr:hypothetical protein [Tanacetum cinerariifolium]
MAPLTFADTHNMIAFLSKSGASIGFDQIVDFLNAQVIHYALMVNPTIYVSCIKQFWATTSIKKVNDVVKLQALIDKKKRTTWKEFSCSMASAVICLATVLINNQVDDLSSHTTKYTSPALTQKVFSNMRRIGKGFYSVETPLFATMLVQPQVVEEEEDEENDVPVAPTPPSPIHAPSPPQAQHPTPSSPPQAQPASPSSPPQVHPQPDTSESSMSILNTLMETDCKTCATFSQKVAHLEQDKIAQDLKIIKLKERVKKLEKQRRAKSSGLKRLRKVGTSQRVESSAETIIGAELQRRIERKDDDNVVKEVNAAEPTVFDDEKVTMTMAQTLIKMKAEKSRILDEKMAKRLHDEEVEQAAAREKQEQDDFKRS